MDNLTPSAGEPAGHVVVPTVLSEGPPQRAARPPRSSAWGCLAMALGLGLVVSLLANVALVGKFEGFGTSDKSVKQKFHSLNRGGTHKVALLELSGAIMDGENTKRIIDAIRNDKSVKAVVLRVDSPGGTVSASDYIYHHLSEMTRERDLPLVVSMGGIAASGGYYVAMAVGHAPDTIFAEPTTWTGSIGVIIPHYNLAGFLEEHKIVEDSIKSHPLKSLGSFTQPMTETERKILQGLVDDSFERFKGVVKAGRARFEESPEQLDDVATGQVFSADQARAKGLVDKIGYIEEAIDRAIELAGIDKEDTRVVKFQREISFFDILTGGEVRAPGMSLAELLDLTVPRAYYMCTRLPALESMISPRSR